jgi:hypothetical protein
MIKCSRTSLVVLILLSPWVNAYDIATHRKISAAAASQSMLGTPSDEGRKRLGLDGLIGQPQFSNSKGDTRTIVQLIADGAEFEDDAPKPIHHFFDPRTGRALSINQSDYYFASTAEQVLGYIAIGAVNAAARTSPDWALGESGTTALENRFSYAAAKQYFYRGMTDPVSLLRNQNLSLLFESLGHVIHHIEDMAQPQHVRNDAHLQIEAWDENCPPGNICGAYQSLSRPSAYEAWTNREEILPYLETAGYPPVYSASGQGMDGLPVFTGPHQFWTNSGLGLADFTNRNFFSAGTLDQSPPTVGAAFDMRVADLCNGAVPPCSAGLDPNALVTFLPSVVDDRFRTASLPNPYAKAISIFDPEFAGKTSATRLPSVNRFTFAYDHAYLIPRAVGYAAGLINYFFRGSMEIMPPDEGVYGILDHTPNDNTSAGCGTLCGFRKIKLKLRNTTPQDDMVSSGGNMGTLVIVAKYHANTCYRPDLSGEYGAPAHGTTCRSSEESIVVSNPLNVSSVGRAFSTQPLEFTFPPNTPIPVNATDLYLQVVYQGQLGQESDAVAVTTIDLSEPTYLTFGNHWDYFPLYNNDGTFASVLPYEPAGRYSVHFELRFNPSQASPIAIAQQLDPGYYHRVAVLTDKPVLDYAIVENYIGAPPDTQAFSVVTTVNQTDAQGQNTDSPPYVRLRQTTPTSWTYEPDTIGSTVSWVPGSGCVNNTTTCVPVDHTIAEVTRRYPPFKQPTPTPMTINF